MQTIKEKIEARCREKGSRLQSRQVAALVEILDEDILPRLAALEARVNELSVGADPDALR